MRLAWVVACLDASVNGRVVDATGLGIDTFWVIECPAEIRSCLLLAFKGVEQDFSTEAEYPVDVQLVNEGLTTFEDLSFEFTPSGVPADHEPGWEVTEVIAIGVEFTAERPGGYCVDVWFGGDRHPHSPYFLVREGIPSSF